jgi:SAM-dependent methyltransferase
MAEQDKVWEFYGEKDPYFGVATIDKFKEANLTLSAKDEFFKSGEDHIKRIWQEIEESFVKNFKPKRAMDFGCGVGRLVLPLAEKCDEIIGVDISPQMIEEAKKNCAERGIENAGFFLSDENLSKIEGKFDLIHSFIVFQHINPKTGEKIFKKMLEKLSDGGIGVLQFTFNHRGSKASVMRFNIYRDFPIIYRLRNLVIRQKHEPLMPMHEYNLNRLFVMLKDSDCHKSVVRFSHHGFDGVVIYFQKIKAEIY